MYSKNQKISCHFPLEVPGTMVTLVAQIPSSDVIVLDIFDNFWVQHRQNWPSPSWWKV